MFTLEVVLCSFQFETEAEETKLRRDVLAEGKVGTRPSTSGLVSILSGQEEMFAFRRAVSAKIFVLNFYHWKRSTFPWLVFNYVIGHLALQISRLIEMQTPLYLELHPSFRQQGPALASNRTASRSAPPV
jgi:hypothetical protein